MKKQILTRIIICAIFGIYAQVIFAQNPLSVSDNAQVNTFSTVSGYCTTGLGGGTFDIANVSISGTTFNNVAGSKSVAGDGSYYTSYPANGGNTCTLTAGSTYTFTITTSNNNIISVWIDYNQNGIYEASEWTQVSTNSLTSASSSVSLVIPATATIGQTGLRIRTRSSGSQNGASDACSSFGSGCTDDYTVTIASPMPTKPVANFYTLSTTTTTGSPVKFKDLTTGVPTSWKWTFTGGTPATSTSASPSVTYSENGTYAVKLVVSNSIGTDSITKLAYITVSNSINIPVTGSSSVNTCDITIYDDGGLASYSNSSNGTLTIYPATAGNAVKIQFNEFSTESYGDVLSIYNGTSISAPQIASYSGSTIPAAVTATNTTGALTLRFTSNSYSSGNGFVAQTSCVPLVLQNISDVAWASGVDNNQNTYYQNRTLNYSIKNDDVNPASLYTKVYYKLSTASTYTLSSSSSFTVSPSYNQTQNAIFSGITTQGLYDCKIELYNSSNVLLNVFDATTNPILGNIRFESATDDITPSYCIGGLSGGSFDITAVSITGTNLNNNSARPGLRSSDGSYYTMFNPTGSNTCTLTSGMRYILNVTSLNQSTISLWIDYNKDQIFQSNEWVQVAASSVANSPSSVSFTVPSTAVMGQTRMRIRTNYTYYANGATNACTNFNYGCTEDYTITIAPPVLAKPAADFIASTTNVSIGSQIQFNDLTTGAPASWTWTFTGGTPETSNAQHPTVTYNTAGIYPVKLVARNSLGSDSITKTDYITIVNTVKVPASGSNTITACGITVYDNGGVSNYSNSTNGVLTINPTTAGSAVRLQFSEFSTESCCDALYVYNGVNTSAPLLGTFGGSTIPAPIFATNSTGALTLRFSSDGSSNSTGFVAQASCIPLSSQYITTASWTGTMDNNYNDFAQAKTLNFTVKNDDVVAKTLFAKIYHKLKTAIDYTLLVTTPSFNVNGNSLSILQTNVLTGFTTKGTYDIKVEIYNSSNSLVYSYDVLSNSILGNQKFESIADDGPLSICVGNLGGGNFDISGVSITGTLLNNSAIRNAVRTLDGSYFTEFNPSGTNTCTLLSGSIYTINVTTKNADKISMWIDFNRDNVFQNNEWVQVTLSSTANSPASVIFIVPNTATNGLARMRIRTVTSSAANGATDACTNFTSGCTEDYYVTIATPILAKPVVDFVANSTSVALGSSIVFNDLTTGIPTSWNWTFEGGTPASSTNKIQTVTYNNAGTYSVKLVAKNELGTDSLTKTGYITIVNSVNMPTSGSNTITACGLTIYDDGEKSNYSNSANGVLTIKPPVAGNAIKLQFSEFNTESYSDILYVYNGLTTSAPLIASFSGSNIPAAIKATNATGALTLRFSTDGSSLYSGFVAQATCIPLINEYISTVSWTKTVDNNYNSYTQSRQLNIVASNYSSSASTYYLKIYSKLTTGSSYQLIGSTSNFSIAPNSNSETILYNISNILPRGYYDFKIELYNASNSLLGTYDFNDNAILRNQGFELVSTDGLPSYCTSGLGGSGTSDISLVSIVGTTLNNNSVRSSSSSFITYSAAVPFTGTIGIGSYKTLQVQTTNNDIISVWIDFDHSGTFDAAEWTQVSTSSNATLATASIYVPVYALTGQTRMRIRTRSAGTSNYSTDACTAFSSGCTEDYIINIELLSGVSEYEMKDFKVYPNPVINDLNISIPGFTTGTLTISDMLGRTILTKNIAGETITENVSHISKGMYIVSVKLQNGGLLRKQILIQK